MDKRSTTDQNVVGSSTNGRNNSAKKAALDKLHQMEWIRNKQEPWHLPRSNTKAEGFTKNKSNNVGNSHHGRTENKQNKKQNPDAASSSSSTVQDQRTKTVPCSAPPVNAWSKRMGSALFSKPTQEDDEDEMLKLALKESLKTAEQEQMRQMGRMYTSRCMEDQLDLANQEIAKQNIGVRYEYTNSEISSTNTQDLLFTDPKLSNEAFSIHNQSLQSPYLDSRKLIDSNDRGSFNNGKLSTSHFKTQLNENKLSETLAPLDNLDSYYKKQTPPGTIFNDSDNCFDKRQDFHPFTLHDKIESISLGQDKNSINTSSSYHNLTTEFASNLTISNNDDSISRHSNYNYETPSYDPIKTPNHSVPILNQSVSHSSSNISNFKETDDETEKILRDFIRRDPPSSRLEPNLSQQYADPSSVQKHFLLNGDTEPVLNINNSDSSGINFPVQPVNTNPYGTIGKDTPASHPEAQQVTVLTPNYTYTGNVPNNLQVSSSVQVMQGTPNHLTYSTMPAFPILQHPLRTPYGFPNNNLIVSQDLISHPIQHQQILDANAFHRFQRAQLISMGPTQVNEPQIILNENPQVMQQQLHMFQPAQLAPPVIKPQQDISRNLEKAVDQESIQTQTKSKEELQQEYIKAMQHLNHLKHQLASAELTEQNQLTQQSNFANPLPTNIFYSGLQPIPPPQTTQADESLNSDSYLLSLLNANIEISSSQPTTGEPSLVVGRGRGRLSKHYTSD